LAVIGLVVAALFAFSPTAGAVEFDPIPKVTYSQECGADGALHLTFVMANEGAGTAHFNFTWYTTVGGSGTSSGNNDFEASDTPVENEFPVWDGEAATFTVTSTDGPGVDFTLEVPEVDCLANPVASIAVICPSTPADGPVLEYTYQNDSQIPVDFTFVDTYGPDILQSGAKNMSKPATETRDLYEDHPGHAAVYADGVLLDSLDTAVDCAPPNHIVVSKTVIGGVGNPAFDFEVVCRPDFDSPVTVVDSFSLHNGESKSVDLPYIYSYCDAHEIDPGPDWTVTELFNDFPMDAPFGEHFFPNATDYTLDVTNTATLKPIPIIPGDTIPDTTIPDSTIPESTIPVTTIPDSTVPDSVVPATEPAPPTVQATPVAVSDSGTEAATPTPGNADTLPRTGSNTRTPLMVGSALLAAGLTLVGATRRSRRRTA